MRHQHKKQHVVLAKRGGKTKLDKAAKMRGKQIAGKILNFRLNGWQQTLKQQWRNAVR